jgi:large subunit ribosomal protein L25
LQSRNVNEIEVAKDFVVDMLLRFQFYNLTAEHFMAKPVSLKASRRMGVGRRGARQARANSQIPAVIYGSKIQPTAIQVECIELERLFKQATSENMLVDLTLDEGGKTSNRLAFIQDIQHSALTDKVLHIDFHEIRADEKLHARVIVIPLGEPEGVRTGGGVLEQALREVEVECLPKDLPDRIEIDVSQLQIGANIHVNQLQPPSGVTILSHADVSVFSVLAPVKEEVVAAVAAEATEPEMIKKKTEEGEAEKPEAAKAGGKAEGKADAKGADSKAGAKPAAKK